MEWNLIPDKRKFLPRIIKHSGLKNQTVGKANQPSAGQIICEIITAKLPQCRIEVTYFHYIAFELIQLYSVSDAIRIADNNIEPADEGRDGSLQCKAKDERNKPQRNGGRIP